MHNTLGRLRDEPQVRHHPQPANDVDEKFLTVRAWGTPAPLLRVRRAEMVLRQRRDKPKLVPWENPFDKMEIS
jgi:hypothetical protein